MGHNESIITKYIAHANLTSRIKLYPELYLWTLLYTYWLLGFGIKCTGMMMSLLLVNLEYRFDVFKCL